MKTTNIYYIIDTSVKTRGIVANRIKQNITKVARALEFCPYKTKLHIIGYSDKAFFVHPFNAYLPMLVTLPLSGITLFLHPAISVFDSASIKQLPAE